LETKVADKDYTAAASLQIEISEVEHRIDAMEAGVSVVDEGRRHERSKLQGSLESLRTELDSHAEKKDYVAAAAAQVKVQQLERSIAALESCSSVSAFTSLSTEEAEIRAREDRLAQTRDQLRHLKSSAAFHASVQDYSAAAEVQESIVKMEQLLVDVSAPVPSVSLSAKGNYELSQIMRHTVSLPTQINLRGLMVLSLSPLSQIPSSMKGKGKTKEKTKGDGKGKSKAGMMGMSVHRVMYAGSDGYIACIIASDDAGANELKNIRVGKHIDFEKAKPRPGKLGIFDVTAQSRIVNRLSLQATAAPYAFPYYVDEVSETFATMDFARKQPVNHVVDLAICCTSVEERSKQDELKEPYLVLHGVDSNGGQVGPLRLWRFDASYAKRDGLYIVRGLKVTSATRWSDEAWKYVPWVEGPKTMECTFRTVAEDVSHVSTIVHYFHCANLF